MVDNIDGTFGYLLFIWYSFQIVAVTLDNYELLPMDKDNHISDNFDDHWVQSHRGEGHIEATTGAIRRVPSWKEVWDFKGELNLTRYANHHVSFVLCSRF